MVVDPTKQVKCDLSFTRKRATKRNAFIIRERKMKKYFLYVCLFVQPIQELQGILIISFEDKSGMKKHNMNQKKKQIHHKIWTLKNIKD